MTGGAVSTLARSVRIRSASPRLQAGRPTSTVVRVHERAVERRIVTVLFTDLVGFTTLAESLDPEDVAIVQDAYFTTVEETVARYGGRLEKFIGDAAVAVFGVPRTRDDDAERSVRAGLALASAVEQLAARVGLEEGELRLRVGVNTGEVVYGEGAPERGPVTGDTVNVAARLQSAAPPGGILVGAATALAVAESIVLEDTGALDLKGKAKPTRAWLALDVRPESSREEAMSGLQAPTLGRDEELAQLLETLRGTAAGGASARLLVVAPPGVGKSRLVDEFAHAAGGAVVVCKARLRPDVLLPYDAVALLMLGALTAAGMAPGTASPEGVEALLRESLLSSGTRGTRADEVIAATLGVIWPGRSEAARGTADERETMFAAWLEAFDALANGRTGLWIVEDAHWAGGDLLAFLAEAGRATGSRLVVVTARQGVLDFAAEWAQSASRIVELAPLSDDAARGLIRALVGEALPGEIVNRVAEASDGNPLFVEELLRSWISAGLLVPTDEGWLLTVAAADVAVPSTVQTVYASQIDDLSPAARLVARRASVQGRQFAFAALGVLGVPEPAAGVESLARRALIAGPESDSVLGATYAFRHALLRDAGYASLARAERARLHVQLAGWLESLARDQGSQLAEVVGRHYAAALEHVPRLAPEVAPGLDRAEAARRAALWFEEAANEALGVAAHEAARALFRRSLELTADEDLVGQARRRARLGEITARSADMNEGAAELVRARELFALLLADGGGTTVRAGFARATVSLGWVFNQQVRFADAEQLADDALALLGDAENAETARLLLLRGTARAMATDEVEIPLADIRRALHLARVTGDVELELDALAMVTRFDADTGATGVEDFRRLAKLSVESGRWATASEAIRMEAILLLEEAPEEASAALDRAGDLCLARGLTEELAWTNYARVELRLLAGAWDEAVAAGLDALGLAEPNGYRRAAIRTYYALLPIAAARGEDELVRRAYQFSERARPHFPAVPGPWARVMSTAADLHFGALGLARTARYPVDEDACLPAFDDAAVLPSWCAAVEVLFESWLRADQAERVQEALDRAERATQVANAVSLLWRAAIPLEQARVHLATGVEPRAVACAREAVTRIRELGAWWWLAKGLRLLDDLDAAPADGVTELVTIERRLGIPSAPSDGAGGPASDTLAARARTRG